MIAVDQMSRSEHIGTLATVWYRDVLSVYVLRYVRAGLPIAGRCRRRGPLEVTSAVILRWHRTPGDRYTMTANHMGGLPAGWGNVAEVT